LLLYEESDDGGEGKSIELAFSEGRLCKVDGICGTAGNDSETDCGFMKCLMLFILAWASLVNIGMVDVLFNALFGRGSCDNVRVFSERVSTLIRLADDSVDKPAGYILDGSDSVLLYGFCAGADTLLIGVTGALFDVVTIEVSMCFTKNFRGRWSTTEMILGLVTGM